MRQVESAAVLSKVAYINSAEPDGDHRDDSCLPDSSELRRKCRTVRTTGRAPGGKKRRA